MRKLISTTWILPATSCLLILAGCTKNSTSGGSSDSAANFPKADPQLKMLGLPELAIPEDNLITKEKVVLGDKLFNDIRFSSTGKVSCATCHDPNKFFTDSPLRVSKGIDDLEGTRNAPTVLNSAFNHTQFWDGRSPSLEDQAQHPFLNPVEMNLKTHEPILKIVKEDQDYIKQFKEVFDIEPSQISMDHVLKAIAAFERTLVAGNSRFDRWYYNGEDVLTAEEKKGFDVYIGNGRCVSCHMIEHTTALFTDHKFYNVGVGINKVSLEDVGRLTKSFLEANLNSQEVDEKVLTDPLTSELGRFAVTKDLADLGNFKTSTLRNIEHTAPYMHDGSLKTLKEVVEHYNRGGASSDEEKINPFLSGGIKPLNLTEAEINQLVAFLETLNSPEFEGRSQK